MEKPAFPSSCDSTTSTCLRWGTESSYERRLGPEEHNLSVLKRNMRGGCDVGRSEDGFL